MQEYLDAYEATHDLDSIRCSWLRSSTTLCTLISISVSTHEGVLPSMTRWGDLQTLFDKQLPETVSHGDSSLIRTANTDGPDSEATPIRFRCPTWTICAVIGELLTSPMCPVMMGGEQLLVRHLYMYSTLGSTRSVPSLPGM